MAPSLVLAGGLAVGVVALLLVKGRATASPSTGDVRVGDEVRVPISAVQGARGTTGATVVLLVERVVGSKITGRIVEFNDRRVPSDFFAETITVDRASVTEVRRS